MNDVVVFLHSTGTGPILFHGVPPSVLGGRAAIHPAHLGYPPGPAIPRGTHVSVQDDVAALLRRLPAEPRLHLVGHSYGAVVALLAAKELAPRVRSMFLYEPVLFSALGDDVQDPEVAKELHSFDRHPWFLADETRGGGREWMEIFVDYWNQPGTWGGFPDAMQESLLALGWKMFLEVRSCFAPMTSLSSFMLPGAVTLAYGDRSPAASRAMARGLAAGRDNVRLVALPGVGHMAPLTDPDRVYAAMREHFVAHSAADF
jgi:pimeloyl-ACP methyl ester carboxylesterase